MFITTNIIKRNNTSRYFARGILQSWWEAKKRKTVIATATAPRHPDDFNLCYTCWWRHNIPIHCYDTSIYSNWKLRNHEDVLYLYSNVIIHHCRTTVYSRYQQSKHKHRMTWSLRGILGWYGGLPSQSTSNTDRVCIWWRHHGLLWHTWYPVATCMAPQLLEFELHNHKTWYALVYSHRRRGRACGGRHRGQLRGPQRQGRYWKHSGPRWN